ncbi:MAG: RHS repeat-associated core domain-containing protein, partial [Phycisphaerae bacterium]
MVQNSLASVVSLCRRGENRFLSPDMPILRHRALGSCLDVGGRSADASGNVNQTTDAGANITATLSYDSFGNVTDNSGLANPTVAWQGKQGYQFEQPLGLQYVRQRWYDPVTRQFISQDPLGFPDATVPWGIESGQVSGGDVNLFRYAGNNPVNRNDPGGMADTQVQAIQQLAQITAIEQANAIKTLPLLDEYYALQLAASQFFPIGVYHLNFWSGRGRIAEAIRASVGRLRPPSMLGPTVPYTPGEAPALWQQQLTQARHAFARELNITEFELYQTLEAEGRTAQANAYAATMAQTIYGDITLIAHPSSFLVGRYGFWESLLQGREEILDFFRRFPNATYGKWPHGTYLASPYYVPRPHYLFKPITVTLHRPITTSAEQLFLAGLFGKYTGGAKPIQEHETYDSGPESEQEGNRTQ